MHRLTLQLAVADPLGFENDQHFAAQMAAAIGDQIISAPLPLVDFNPIRSGLLSVTNLQVIDSFGLSRAVTPNWISSSATPYNAQSNAYELTPRVVPPVTLKCNWLAGDQQDQLLTNHSLISPICGWLTPNNLDRSLMIYDADGKCIGAITQNTHQSWQPLPGNPDSISVSQIANPHLRTLVDWILQQGTDFLSDFLLSLDTSLQNIHPENVQQHQCLALLFGRPIAVCRIAIDFIQATPYDTDQSWTAFRYRLQHGATDTHGYERIEFPVRVGESNQLNDGVLGYFQEPLAENAKATYFCVQQTDPGDSVNTHDALKKPTELARIVPSVNLLHTLDAAPTVFVFS